jgi:protein SCO1/2
MKTILVSLALCAPWAAAGAARAGCCATNTTPSCCARPEAPARFSEKSLYQTESSWAADSGKQIKLSSLSRTPQVVVMFFASCTYACPVLVNDLRRIEAALPEESRHKIGFTLVSFDSKRDTPEALADYRSIRNLDPKRWTLLHGQPDDVLELAALLGVRFKEDAAGQFAHSNIITILNEQGEIVYQVTGLNQDIGPAVSALTKLIASKDVAAK